MRSRTDVYIGLMRDGSAIEVATDAAAIAVRAGDLAAARGTLSTVLGAASASAIADVPVDVDAPLDIAEAASLYARVLAITGSARDGLAYSASAYRMTCEAAEPGSDLRLRAAATHAYLLRTTGDPAAAVPVGRDLARQLIARFGATDRRTLAAHGDLAVTLHAAGECLTGRQILHRTGELVRSTYGPDDPLGIRMRNRLTDLTRDCRPLDEAVVESPDTVADHTCGQPNAAASISIVDLFGDLFAGDADAVVARPPDAAADPTETPPTVTDRPAIPSAGLVATLGVAIPAARPPAPAELRAPPTEVAAPAADVAARAAEVPAPAGSPPPAAVRAPAGIGVEPIDGLPVEPSGHPHVAVEVADATEVGETAAAATSGREHSRTPDTSATATAPDNDGGLSPAARLGRIEAPESEVPPWADRPTAGFPTVPVAVGLHPTWVAAPPEPVSAPRPIGETSTVGVTGNNVTGQSAVDLPVTHSRATFGRIRRLATHAGASDRPQRTAKTK